MKSSNPIILHVEPNLSCARLMQLLLRRFKHCQIIHTATAEKAFTISRQAQPKLILTEMKLGDISGLDLAKQLRANKNTQHIPILGISANAHPADIQKALQCGLDAYIKKPFNLHELYSGVNRFINA